jgi:hypothetical protein
MEIIITSLYRIFSIFMGKPAFCEEKQYKNDVRYGVS